MKKICIVGMGNMGSAIFEALKNDFEVVGCDKDNDVSEFIQNSDIVILAVKPQSFEDLAGMIKCDLNDKIVISIMTGVSIGKISKLLNVAKIVRSMPNLPLKVGVGFTVWISKISDSEKETVRKVFRCFGEEIEIDDESKMSAVTAIAGSGPAYYYSLNRALKMKAIDLGFADTDAAKMVRQTFLGAAELLKKSDECSEKLIEKVKSKGGTTEAALNIFDAEGFEKIIFDAVDAAKNRSDELSKY